MIDSNLDRFCTEAVHAATQKVRAIAPTITPSAAFGYESAKEAEAIFSGEAQKPLYARMGNPTNATLENAIAQMEGAYGAIATSSGMGALAMMLTALLQSGDRVVCVGGFFGGTYSLLTQTLARFGVKSDFFGIEEVSAVRKACEDGAKVLLFESVGNPSLTLADIQTLIDISNQTDTISIVDNTVTPLLLRPLKMGADLVFHSTTKSISGFAGPLGGIALFRALKDDNEKLLSDKFAPLHPLVKKAQKKAFMAIFKKRALRDFGMSASAMSSYITLLGLETLPLRIARVNETVVKVSRALRDELAGYDIHLNHPSLSDHPYHERYKRYFPNGCGALLNLEFGTKERAFRFLDNLQMAIKTANIGDNRTLALHMASTIYRDFDDETRKFLGVTDGLVRISIGLESAEDIIKDFLQAASRTLS